MRDLSGLSCSEQWAALAETPRLMRWWHFISLSADNLQAGLVSGWAWYLAGASWRTAPAAAYACLGTLISFSVLLHGPAAKITHIGPFMGACQLYMAALPLFQPVHRKPLKSTAAHLGFSALSIFLTNLASTASFEIMQGSGVRRLSFKDDVLINGAVFAIWRLDSMTDMGVVYIILSKAKEGLCPVLGGVPRCNLLLILGSLQAVLASIDILLSAAQQFIGKALTDAGRSGQRINAGIGITSSICELGKLGIAAAMLYLDARGGAAAREDPRPGMPGSHTLHNEIVYISCSAVLTLLILAVRVVGVHQALEGLRAFGRRTASSIGGAVRRLAAAAAWPGAGGRSGRCTPVLRSGRGQDDRLASRGKVVPCDNDGVAKADIDGRGTRDDGSHHLGSMPVQGATTAQPQEILAADRGQLDVHVDTAEAGGGLDHVGCALIDDVGDAGGRAH